MSEPTFTTPPAVPSRLSPAEFSDRMNAFRLYFPTLQGELSTAVSCMAAAVSKLNNVVASNAGWTARRAIVASITGAGVTYPDAKRVLGTLSRETFDACAERKRNAMSTGSAESL